MTGDLSKIHEDIGALKAESKASQKQREVLFAESKEQTQSLTRIEAAISSLALAHEASTEASQKKHDKIEAELEAMDEDISGLKSWKTYTMAFGAGVAFVFTAAWAALKEIVF